MISTDQTYQVNFQKPKYLRDFLDGFLIYHFTDEQLVLMNPGGYFELIFQINCEIYQTTSSSDNWQQRPLSFVGGLHNQSYIVKPAQKNSKLISVKIKPNCSSYFIPDRLNLYKNRIVSLDDIYPMSAMQWLEEVLSDQNLPEKLNSIEKFLVGTFSKKDNSRIDHVLREIYIRNGFITIDQLTQKAFLSRSQLRNRFNEEVGMSPKEYSKIVRINHIINILAKEPEIKLTELTYRLGYFDQAHFIKDFKSVTGLSPTQYIHTSRKE